MAAAITDQPLLAPHPGSLGHGLIPSSETGAAGRYGGGFGGLGGGGFGLVENMRLILLLHEGRLRRRYRP